ADPTPEPTPEPIPEPAPEPIPEPIPDEGVTHLGTDGDDLFRVHSTRDTIENAGTGTDTVETTVNFTLRRHSDGDDLDNLVLAGDADLVGVGNSADNVLTGNTGDNHLSGVWGDDTVFGGSGDDTIKGVNGDDWLFGNQGQDEISGGKGHDTLIGGGGDDQLMGDAGDDLLSGEGGNDILTGGEGADRFVVLTDNDGLDVIRDFTLGEDVLDLSFSGARSAADLVVEVQDDRVLIREPGGSGVALLDFDSSDVEMLTDTGTIFSGQGGAAQDPAYVTATAYDYPGDEFLSDPVAYDTAPGGGPADGVLSGW
ncbi:calcium-binding protein, partial [Roseovarius ramblicola]